jgi:hypothetical protein
MARSYKKHPGGGYSTSESEKIDKKLWHRKYRSKNKQALKKMQHHLNINKDYDDDIEMLDIREVSNVWDMSKDGKTYWKWSAEYETDEVRQGKVLISADEKKQYYQKFLRK